jgi:Ser/Thr protein kinase RdoA (MazF antagonist)
MDPNIAARFNDNILQAAIQRYAIADGDIHLLDGYESFMYEFTRPDGAFILRFGHSQRRTPNLIHGEVDWINYLAAGGATVAQAILSQAGNLVEPVEDGQGGQFLCTAFVKAPGGAVRREQINERLFFKYGQLLGRMHALAKDYIPSNPAWKRPAWNNPIFLYVDRMLPARYTRVLEKYPPLKEHLFALPQDSDGYGMIHQDAHPGNFFVDEDYTITLFDFDDCVYGHFIYDIAMVLFYTCMWEKDPAEFTARFMPVFLSGYRQENRLPAHWLKELPYFLKLREIDLFAMILFNDGENPEHPWSARYMQGRRERIEQGTPVIDFEWENLAKYV